MITLFKNEATVSKDERKECESFIPVILDKKKIDISPIFITIRLKKM